MTDTEKYLEEVKKLVANQEKEIVEGKERIAMLEERVKYEKAAEKEKQVLECLKDINSKSEGACHVVTDPYFMKAIEEVLTNRIRENQVLDDLCKKKDERIRSMRRTMHVARAQLADKITTIKLSGKRKYKEDEVACIMSDVAGEFMKKEHKASDILKEELDKWKV